MTVISHGIEEAGVPALGAPENPHGARGVESSAEPMRTSSGHAPTAGAIFLRIFRRLWVRGDPPLGHPWGTRSVRCRGELPKRRVLVELPALLD